MALSTYLLYFIAFGAWYYAVYCEGGIGIGFRFLYSVNLVLFSLVGPLLEQLLDTPDRRFVSASFESAVRLSLFGLLSFFTGAYLAYPLITGKKRLFSAQLAVQLADPARLEIQYKVGWILVGIGLLSLPLNQVMYLIPSLRGTWSQLNSATDTGLVMLTLYAAHARRPSVLFGVFGALAIKGTLLSAMSGHAGSIFFAGGFIASIFYLSSDFKPYKIGLLFAFGVIAFIPAQSWLNERHQLRTAVKNDEAIGDRIAIFIDIFTNSRQKEVDQKSLTEAYRSRGDYTDLLAAAITHTPAVEPYGMGKSYWNILIAPIPRFLWRAKPYTAGGNHFASTYSGIHYNDSTSIQTSHLFEFYVNFGNLGVIVGMFLVGLGIAWMEALYNRRAPHCLYYEYLLIWCAWAACIYCDSLAFLVMTIPSILVASLVVNLGLQRMLHSPFLSYR